jgi:Spy/CpxP family protein refolding chaperone
MKLLAVAFLLACPVSIVSGASAAPPSSAYAGQESRDIKALSQEDISAFLSGKGMGFAKAAELNGYPGPAHVLELEAQLELTPEQRIKTEALRASMESKAASLGHALVEEERQLDRLFATKAVNPELLSNLLSKIGALQARLRGTHLAAHIAQSEILTAEQTARYIHLRGYKGSGEHMGHGGQHKH